MTSQPWKQTIAIYMLSIIVRIEGNQTMKFGQLRQNNMSNIFIEKTYTKYGGKLFPDPFLKNRN